MGKIRKYYSRRRQERKDWSYKVHGDVITPANGDYFTPKGINDALKALKRIGVEKGINKRLYFVKDSTRKRREVIRQGRERGKRL